MNINELQPRVFHNGKLSKIDKIIFENDGILREGIGFFEEGEYGYKHHVYLYFDTDNFKIDRPVGMIKDRYGKEVMLYEHDLLRIDKKFAEKRDTSFMGGYSIIMWNGQDFGFDFWWEGERLRFMRIMENRDDYDVQLIGNVHENPDLAPEWWRHKNANP